MKKLIALLLSVLMLFGGLAVTASAEENTLHYVVLGDSIAYGSGITNPVEACYGKIVADTNGYTYSNHSVPGHTTQNLISRLANEAVLADVKKADIISISIGGNNFLMSDLMGLMADALIKKDYSQFDSIAAGFYADFCKIMDIINENNPEAVVLLQTIYNPQTGRVGEVYQQGADRLNAEMRRYAQENPGEIVIVEVAAALLGDSGNFAYDGIHPSAAGNEKIAVAILEVLAELGLGASSQPVINAAGQDFAVSKLFGSMINVIADIFYFLGLIFDFFASKLVMPL